MASGLDAIVGVDTSYFKGGFQVAYITDADNDPETVNDQGLTVVDSNGVVTYTHFNGNPLATPQFVTVNGGKVLSWRESEEIIESEGSRSDSFIRYYDGWWANSVFNRRFGYANVKLQDFQ